MEFTIMVPVSNNPIMGVKIGVNTFYKLYRNDHENKAEKQSID